jgi:hypothetical protein
VYGLGYPLHRPTAYSRQTRGHGFLSDVVLSRRAAKGDGALLGDTQPRAWIFVEALDCLDTCVIEFYIECIACLLGYVYLVFRSIMVCIHVSLVEPSFQTVIGRVPALEYTM